MSGALHVCWGRSDYFLNKIKSEDSVLHFPMDYSDFGESVECAQFFNGIKESLEVRDLVISDYLAITADIGLVKKNAQTFRNALRVDTLSESLWWYHMVSFRNNTVSPEFDEMVQIYTVKKVFEKSGCTDIIFHSISFKLAEVFKSRWPHSQYTIIGSNESLLWAFVRGLASRCKYFINSAKKIIITAKFKKTHNQAVDILFFGFWDWSVSQGQNGKLEDKYYKRLPQCLSKLGITKQGWLVLFDPHSKPGSEKRPMMSVIPESCHNNNVFFLQSYLSILDLLKESLRLRPYFKFLSYQKRIHTVTHGEGFNLYPLFRKELHYRFFDSSLVHLRLIELAVRRACSELSPKVTLNFLETHLISRACYSGIRLANKSSIRVSMQHASRNEESIFFRCHPTKEFPVGVDKETLPKADYHCVMGELGAKIVAESGYPNDQIKLTGSPRFDHVVRLKSTVKKRNAERCILFAASGVIELEIPAFLMTVKAIHGLCGIKLVLREHFFWKVSVHPEVKAILDRIEISNRSLDDDLNRADLVLFTTTTLAEEALMREIPVWQIISEKSNFSSLRAMNEVKKFYSEKQIRFALNKSIQQGYFDVVSPSFVDQVERNCFFKCDGHSAERMSAQIKQLICNKNTKA